MSEGNKMVRMNSKPLHTISETGFTTIKKDEVREPFQSSLQTLLEERERLLRRPDPLQKTPLELGGLSSANTEHHLQSLVHKSHIAYMMDSMVRQSVDRYSELFTGFELRGETKQVDYVKKRLSHMSLVSGEDWEATLTRAITEYFKTGNAFIAKRRGNAPYTTRSLYENSPYPIYALSLVASHRLTPSTDGSGFLQGWKLESGGRGENLNLIERGATPLDKERSLIRLRGRDEKNVLRPGLHIVHFAYKRAADSFWGFGITLGALEDVALIRAMEQTTAVMTKKFSAPIIHHKITRNSNPLKSIQTEINEALRLHRTAAPDGVLVTGDNAEIKAIGSESQALRVEGYLNYFLSRTLAGMGVSTFLLGLEGGGIGTVEAAIELMMMKARFCQAEIARIFETYIINEILWEGGFDPFTVETDKVHLEFLAMDEARSIKLATHAADMFTKNLWGHKEARDWSKSPTSLPQSDLYIDIVDKKKINLEGEQKLQQISKQNKKAVGGSTRNGMEYISMMWPSHSKYLSSFFESLNVAFEGVDWEETDRTHILNLYPDKDAALLYIKERVEKE